jgi:hypothetical protein
MRMIVEHLAEWRLAGETEVLGENLSQRHQRDSFTFTALVYFLYVFLNFSWCASGRDIGALHFVLFEKFTDTKRSRE